MELISKNDVIKALQKWNCRDYDSLTINPYEVLRDIPTVEERKEGKWIKRDKWLYCSACDGGGWGLGAVTYEWQYCPLCGAKIGE